MQLQDQAIERTDVAKALVALHMQEGVVDNCGPDGVAAVERLATAIASTRDRGIPVISVRMEFEPGLVDLDPAQRANPFLARFERGTAGARTHASIAPMAGDIDIVGKRASAFKRSDLPEVLAALGVTDLVFAGIGTSGTVLATVLEAADLDYDVSVLSDACADPDQRVHTLLCERVLPMRAAVLTVEQWSS